ncbi:hypothetical protein SprV_0902737800 [Sparganum proliferum]
MSRAFSIDRLLDSPEEGFAQSLPFPQTLIASSPKEDQSSPADEAHDVKSEITSGGGSSSSSPPANDPMCYPPLEDASPPMSISPLACLQYLRLLSTQLGDIAPAAIGIFREFLTPGADTAERSRNQPAVAEGAMADCTNHRRLASPPPLSPSSAEDAETEKSSGPHPPGADVHAGDFLSRSGSVPQVSLDDPTDFYLRCNRPRRSRTTFTTLQLHVLEAAFSINHYPDVAMRDQLANQLKLSDGRVQVSGLILTLSVTPVCCSLRSWLQILTSMEFCALINSERVDDNGACLTGPVSGRRSIAIMPLCSRLA